MQQVAYAEFRLIFVMRERKPDGRKQNPIFLGLFYKSANICFYCECTQIKANLLQFRLSSKEYLLPLLEGKRKSSYCSSAACAHTVKLSTFTMQPVHYHYKKTISQTYGKKHTAQFKYVVKSVPLCVITVPPWSYAKHFVLRGYWNVTEADLHKR